MEQVLDPSLAIRFASVCIYLVHFKQKKVFSDLVQV
jgi:hypothetical protein